MLTADSSDIENNDSEECETAEEIDTKIQDITNTTDIAEDENTTEINLHEDNDTKRDVIERTDENYDCQTTEEVNAQDQDITNTKDIADAIIRNVIETTEDTLEIPTEISVDTTHEDAKEDTTNDDANEEQGSIFKPKKKMAQWLPREAY